MRRLAALVFLASGMLACGGEPWPPDLELVEHPGLAAAEDVARRQLESRRGELAALLDRGRGDRRQLAEAFGEMGRLYQAYRLLPAAASCYRNAEKLDPESTLWPYYLGLAEQSAGRFAAAAGRFERVLDLLPGNAPARLRLAEVRLASNETQAARELLEPLLDDERYAAAAHAGLGRAAAAGGDPAGAARHFAEALELQPQAGSVRHALGVALRQLGRADEARAHLEAGGAGQVSYPDPLAERLETLAAGSGAHLRRANRALMAGRLEEAVAAFRDAIEADPRNTAARRNLALALLRQGAAGEAAQQLEAALEIDPDDARLHFDLGNCRRAAGAGDAAVAAFRRALELAPDFADAHFNLANALAGMDRWEEAAAHLDRVLELEGDHGRARYLAAMALHHRGRSREALAALRALVEDEPDNRFASQGLMTVHEALGEPQQALAAGREALARGLQASEESVLLGALGRLSWRLGRRDDAIGFWRRAAELAPQSSAAHTELANALQLSGRRAEAAEVFARATELDPRNAAAWLSEATLHILAGDFARAVGRLEEALKQVPEHAGLNHTLARLLATCPDPALRDGERALALAEKARALESTLEHLATVAMALAELGHFEEAVEWQRALLRRAQGRAPEAAMRLLADHLRRYEMGEPVRIGESG